MAKRGKVLRDPYLGPGLLMVEGKQYPFLMEGIWRSDVPAKPGLVVNVDFDPEGNLNSITAVPQTQLNQEQAELVRAGSGTRSAALESFGVEAGTVARLGLNGLIALCWFFLTAVSIHLPVFGKLDLTLWQLLGFLNNSTSPQFSEASSSADPGILGLLAIIALAGPLLPTFWKDRRALFGGWLPLVFMILVAGLTGRTIHAVLAGPLTGVHAQLPTNVGHGIFNVLSVAFGTYLSASLAIYLAVLSAKQLMRFNRLQPMESTRRMAA
jgi:hypothetical protein